MKRRYLYLGLSLLFLSVLIIPLALQAQPPDDEPDSSFQLYLPIIFGSQDH